MLTHPLPLLLTLLLTQKDSPPLETLKCEEVQHIESSRTSLAPREVCVSPGLLTGLFFESHVSVEIQDEGRFEEVSRERTSVSFLPPKGMTPGERLRVSARYTEGKAQDSVTLMLVAAPGQGTRQVEVFRDTRTRESFEEELRQERAKSVRDAQELAQVRLEFERFRQQHGDSRQLHGLIASGSMTSDGIRARAFNSSWEGRRVQEMVVRKGSSYRSVDRLAIAVWLVNLSPHAWSVSSVQLQAGGVTKPVIGFWQQGSTLGNAPFLLIVEADVRLFAQEEGEVTLRMKGNTHQDLTLQGIELP